MPRTSAASVLELVEVDSNVSLDAFILSANELVTEVCVPSGYSDARLELIERWLAAHFYVVRAKKLTSEKAGSVSENFTHSVGLMLKNTEHGQQALMLDTKGGLAALSKQLEEGAATKPGALWLGTEDETEDDE